MSVDPAGGSRKKNAYRACIRLLAVRARSTAEITGYLEKKGYSQELADEVVSQLLQERLLNDQDIAALHVESRMRISPRSGYALRYELRMRGIDEAIIQESVAGVDDLQAALAAVRLKQHQWKHLDPDRVQKKILGLLRTRGFSYEVAMATLETILSQKDKTDGRRN
ncbi:MAG: regulatory protein RecX [Pseudomonadota bacterium]